MRHVVDCTTMPKIAMPNMILVDRALSSTVLVMLLLFCCGCGDSQSPTSSPPQNGSTSIPPPPVTKLTQPTPKRAKSKTAKKPKQNDAEEFVAPTSNDYQIAAPPRENVVPPEDVPEQNYFAVIEAVSDSSLMRVEPPAEKSAASDQQRRSELNLPDGFVMAAKTAMNAQGFPKRIICEGDESEMVLVEGGVYTRGSKTGAADAQPEQLVFISPFYMDIHEITLRQFQKFQTEFNESASKKSNSKNSKVRSPGNERQGGYYPALKIVWRDAENYAKTNGKALPTEAEWERAARGVDSFSYPWGNGRPLTTSVPLEAILPVGSRPTDLTPTGLYDMAGNAQEWTSDWYSAELYSKQATDAGGLIRNPHGPRLPDKLGQRSVRGSQGTWKLWQRDHANLRGSAANIGFRCILRITDEMQPAGNN